MIIEHPSSLMIPVNAVGSFSCACNDSRWRGYWIINGSYIDSNDKRSKFEEIGFSFTKNGSAYTLTVNASEAINNTLLFCDFEPIGNNLNSSISTMNAMLLVISLTSKL